MILFLASSIFFSSVQFSSVAQSCLTLCDPIDSKRHTRLPCPSPTPRACSNSCPSSQWCHLTISSSVIPFSSCLQFFPASVFSNESVLCIRWPKDWSFSFSISPSKEYSGLISFRINWVWSPCSPRDSQESSPTPQFKSINSLVLSFLYGTTHIHIWLREKP